MADILRALQGGYQMGAQMQADRRQGKLAELLGKAATSQGSQRQQHLSAAYGVDPGAAMQAESAFGKQEDQRAGRLREKAQLLAKLPPQMRPQAYQSILPELQQMGLGDGIPPEWSEELMPTVEAIANSGQQQNNVQSRFVAEDGRVMMVMRDGQVVDSGQKADRQMWLRDHPGMAPELIGKDGATRPVYDGPASGLIPAVIQQESGGDPNAVSPKGARGLMQVMPQTGQDPGFGVAPLRDGSPQENVRFGTDYLTAMMEKYGDQSLALAAYNAGPGRVDQALQRAGGDPQRALSMLPQETQQYVPSVLQRAGARPSEAQQAAEQESAKRGVALQYAPAEAQAEADRTRMVEEAKAGVEKQTKQPKARLALQQAQSRVERVDALVDSILPRVGTTTSGWLGDKLASIEGTPAADLRKDLGTLQAIAGFDELNAMRAASPTGGALGNVTERELAFLQSVVRNIENSQSEPQLRRNLEAFREELRGSWQRIQRAYDQDFGGQEAAPASDGGLTPEEQAELDQLRAQLGRR